jgi:type IV pilus modification protein PilV
MPLDTPSLSPEESIMSITNSKQSGFVILEALIGILLFTIGALGMIAMYSNAVSRTIDAQYRMEATHHANQLMNLIWINADRSGGGLASPASLEQFAYNADVVDFDPVDGTCEFSGDGDNTVVEEWRNTVKAVVDSVPNPSGLPGTDDQRISVTVDTADDKNQVTITICWQTPQDAEDGPIGRYRVHQLVGNVK